MAKKIIVILAIILALIAVAGGGLYFFRPEQSVSLGKITLGWNAWPGFLPYWVAYDQDFFKQAGLQVNLVEEKKYQSIVSDLISGKIDFAGDIVLIDVVQNDSNGANLKVVLAADYSNGADGIVASKKIKSVSGLKGKKIAVEEGTLGENLLFDALKKNHLSLVDVIEVNLPADQAAQAFISGQVDAAVSYDPYYSQAVDRGNGWKIYTSADSPGLINDTAVFRSDYLDQNTAKASAAIKAYFRAVDFIAQNPDQAYAIGAKYEHITPAEFKQQYAGLKQLGLKDNLDLMAYGTGQNSLHGLVDQAYEFLTLKGTVKNKVDSTQIIDPQFIRQLAE